VAKPNYSFEKRQRELAKQKKKAEKDAEKAARKRANLPPEHADGTEAVDPGTAPGDESPTG
jgi:hypothetical protein